MILGPHYCYKCPQCGQEISRGSLVSGNSFHATYYSDLKVIYPMCPEFPQLTICESCKHIFWINEAECIGEKEWDDDFWFGYEARFLKLEEWIYTLNMRDICYSKEKERFIRLNIWHSFNDRVREGEELIVNEKKQLQWEENCLHLISILDPSDLDDSVRLAELKRNLGKFDDSIKILNSIDHSDCAWIVEPIKEKALAKDTSVFEIVIEKVHKQEDNPKKDFFIKAPSLPFSWAISD